MPATPAYSNGKHIARLANKLEACCYVPILIREAKGDAQACPKKVNGSPSTSCPAGLIARAPPLIDELHGSLSTSQFSGQLGISDRLENIPESRAGFKAVRDQIITCD